MSSPLAIGATSAVLRNLLDNGLIDAGAAMGTTVTVSAVAPDTIDLDGAEAPLRLNVFLYHVTPNAGWRNAAMPSRDARGDRIANPPLALDLHYLLTAYAPADFQAEILLGYAMHLLHEHPVLDRAAMRRALDAGPLDASMLPPAFQALAASDLADQVELLKLTPAALSVDEMSKIWSALQSKYRPSVGYHVSVVLIEATRPARSPLPVLSRGERDPGTGRDRGVQVHPDLLAPVTTLLSVEYRLKQPAARLGEVVTVHGARLDGAGARLRLSHPLLDAPIELPVVPSPDGRRVDFTLPNDAAAQAAWPAGLWRLSLRATPPGSMRERTSNELPLLLSAQPAIAADAGLGLPAATVARTAGGVTVVLSSRPQVRPRQRAVLMLNGAEATAAPRAAATDPLRFVFPATLPANPPGQPYKVRLRVDGVDSVLIDRSGAAPIFDPAMVLEVPA